MDKKKNQPFLRPIAIGLSLLSISCLLVAQEKNSETRGFVISMIHTATYYDEQTCPEGTNGSRPDVLIRRVMRDGYDREEAIRIVSSLRINGGRDDQGNLVGSAIVLGEVRVLVVTKVGTDLVLIPQTSLVCYLTPWLKMLKGDMLLA